MDGDAFQRSLKARRAWLKQAEVAARMRLSVTRLSEVEHERAPDARLRYIYAVRAELEARAHDIVAWLIHERRQEDKTYP